jgi:TetR/AcrR family transcriptional repressor of nem operon
MGRTSDARDRLLDSARELIYERGYTAAGVSEVCQRAGVNKGSFYHFFPSKQALAVEVLDGFATEAREFLASSVDPAAGGTPLERLRRYIVAVAHRQREDRQSCGAVRGCLLGNLALEMSTQDTVIRERVAQELDHQVAVFAGLLEEAMEVGEIPPGDPHQAARALVAFLEGVTLFAKAHNAPGLIEGMASEALRLVGATPMQA